VTPDTALEAITRLRDALGDANHHESLSVMVKCSDLEAILNSHSAGEGLRAVLLDAWPFVSDATMRGRIASALRMDDVGYDPAAPVARIHITPEHEEALHRALLASTETVQVFTPPSDAGSTTRSGGDPVFRLHYLGLLGLISEASPWVDEDTRDSMHSALEDAMRLDPSMRVRRVIDRFVISHVDQPGEAA
jgi:hypothetical protein